MDGFSFKISYKSQRDRIKVLLVPLIIIPYIVLIGSFSTNQSLLDSVSKINHTPSTSKTYNHHVGNKTINPPYSLQHYASRTQNIYAAANIHGKQNSQPIPASHLSSAFFSSAPHLFDRYAKSYNAMPKYAQFFVNFCLFVVFMILIGFSIGTNLIFALPLVLTILFRKKYPTWWFAWNQQAMRFSARIATYALLLSPNIPTLEDSEEITLNLPDPKDRELMRAMPLIKWLLALPHGVILLILTPLTVLLSVLMYPYLLITGSYPKPIFHFIEGVLRWGYRVSCYTFLLCTDEYPKFSLK